MMENNSDSGCSDFEVECVEDEEYSQVLIEEGQMDETESIPNKVANIAKKRKLHLQKG